MRPLDTFTSENPKEEAAMERSKQLCDAGNALCEQGKYQEAIEFFQQDLLLCEEVCGSEHSYVANSLIDISACFRGLGQLDQALEMSQRALDIYEKGMGADHPLTAKGLSSVAICYLQLERSEAGIPLYRRVVAIRENNFGSVSAELAWSLSILAVLHSKLDQFDEALLLYKRVLAIREKIFGEEHVDTLYAIKSLADTYEKLERWDITLTLRQRHLKIAEKFLGSEHTDTLLCLEKLTLAYKEELGPEHAETLDCINHLAMRYEKLKQWDNALPHRHRALEICEKLSGAEHVDVLSSIFALEWVHQKMEQWEQVLLLRQRALAIEKKTYDAEHPDVIQSLTHLANTHEKLKQWEHAMPLRMYLLRLCEKKYGAEHPRSLASFDKLANLYEQLQQWERALPLRERLVILRERVHGQESRQKRESVNAVARLYELLSRYEKALPLRQYLLEVQEQIPYFRNAAANELAVVYEKLGQFEQAQILRQSLPITDEAHHTQTGSTDSDMKRKHIAAADANVDLAQAYVYMGDLGGALEIYQEALETRQEILGSEHADTINIVRLMAEVHEKLGQWDMALPLRQRAWAVCEKLGKAALDKGADAATTTEYQNDSHRDALSDRAIAKANELIMRLAHDIEGRDYCAGYWKEYDIYPLAHHTVLGYLEYLWAGGESDEGFERRSLKKDFNMKGINVAALYYIVAKLRDIPFESVLHFLAPNSTGADESVPATFEKIMVIAPAMNEEGLSGEIKTLAGVVCGAYLDPNQIRYNAAQINDDFDSVGFIVKYCKALELLKQ